MELVIMAAMAGKKLVEFSYGGHIRIAEPHVLGVTGGATQILGYQVGGSSASGGIPEWRRFDLNKISGIKTLSQSFAGSRPSPSGKHSTWDYQIAVLA